MHPIHRRALLGAAIVATGVSLFGCSPGPAAADATTCALLSSEQVAAVFGDEEAGHAPTVLNADKADSCDFQNARGRNTINYTVSPPYASHSALIDDFDAVTDDETCMVAYVQFPTDVGARSFGCYYKAYDHAISTLVFSTSDRLVFVGIAEGGEQSQDFAVEIADILADALD